MCPSTTIASSSNTSPSKAPRRDWREPGQRSSASGQYYRQAFAGFDPAAVARFTAKREAKLLADPGIVRNRLKVASTISNAKAVLAVQDEVGSLDAYLWQFVGGEPRINRWRSMREVPARTAESDAMSKALGTRGFRFVGSTICYAFMQAVGMVNDHTTTCFRHPSLRS